MTSVVYDYSGLYNPDLKREYIEHLCETKDLKYIESFMRLFRASSQYEFEAGKDLCQMSEDEISGVFRRVSSGKTITRRSQRILYNRYCDYCVSNNVAGANQVFTQNTDAVYENPEAIKAILYGSPSHLQAALDLVFDKEYEGTVHNISRACVWLVYSGVPFDALPSLERRHIDFSNQILTLDDGREYSLVRDGMQSIYNVSTFTSFTHNNKNRFGSFTSVRDRVDGDSIFRSYAQTASVPNIWRRVADAVSEWKAEHPENEIVLPMRRDTIALSGEFYRQLDIERKLGAPVLESYIKTHYSFNAESKSRRSSAFGQMLRFAKLDYENWKKAYNHIV